MSSSGYPARTRSHTLVRGVLRAALLLGLAAVAVWWSAEEPTTGNRAFLLTVAGLLGIVAVWGVVATLRELKTFRSLTSRRTD